jgi:glycine/D-amino acid oxidase-like deaminating enzyme
MHQRIGIPSLLVTPDVVRRIAPGFNVDDIDLAAFEPESGYADPSSTVSSFLDAARKLGARLVQDCRVTAVNTDGGKVVGVETSQGDFSSPIVVNAAGPWARQVGQAGRSGFADRTWQRHYVYPPPERPGSYSPDGDRLPQLDVLPGLKPVG